MPAPANVIAVLPFIKAVEDRLNAVIPQPADPAPPIKGYLTEPIDVPKLDADGHVQRYWVLHPFLRLPRLDEQDLAETVVDGDWTFQVTIAASYPRDVYALAPYVDGALFRWAPVVDGYVCGPCTPPLGFDPGPARKDEAVKPYRFWLPLQYRTTITRTS